MKQLLEQTSLTGRQFERARRLALRLAGVELFERHSGLLWRRGQRVGIQDGAALDSFLESVEAGESVATQKFLCLLTTKFTSFFRHPPHFQVATAQALRSVSHRGYARLWSAGAATGEEPYSLAMALIEAFQREDPPVRILATDIDVEALAMARRGEYPNSALQSLQQSQRARFFRETAVARHWGVVPAVRRLVEFRPLNLIGDDWPDGNLFDVIFCRNVLMYLEAQHRYTALARFARSLAPEGVFILDPTEHLGRAAYLFAACVNGVCAHRRQMSAPNAGAPGPQTWG